MKPEDVKTRQDLAAFVRELVTEFRGEGKDEWENPELGRYLEAFGGWVDDMDGWFSFKKEETPSEPSWSMVAMMLRAATTYE